jgi:1,4-dihydroxy-2-naphthoyl-CoA synthase
VAQDYTDLPCEIRDGIALLTLDRPEKLNAWSAAMGRSLSRAYRECDLDDAVRAVVLTGAGRAFVGRLETALHVHLMSRADAVEGPVAYLERRKPDWKLRVGRDWPDWPV